MSSAAVLGGAVPHPDAPAAAGSTTLRVLTLTSLFPSVARPRHGIFVETRLVHLLRSRPEVDARVVAPVPWFPFQGEAFGQYGRFAATPRRTTRGPVTWSSSRRSRRRATRSRRVRGSRWSFMSTPTIGS